MQQAKKQMKVQQNEGLTLDSAYQEAGLQDLGVGTLLAPVPVALIGTGNQEEYNFFTVAWTGVVNSEPPMVSISVRTERYSYGLLCKTGRFSLHLTDESLCRDVDFCGVRSGAQVNKAKTLGWKPILVSDHPPVLPQAPVCLLCTVQHAQDLGSHVLFLALIDQVLVREDCMSAEGALQLQKLGLVAYAHGVYHKLSEPIGFFGYSVAAPAVYSRRMKRLLTESQTLPPRQTRMQQFPSKGKKGRVSKRSTLSRPSPRRSFRSSGTGSSGARKQREKKN